MEDVQNDGTGAVPVLLFRVRSRLYALPVGHVMETMRPLPVETVAGAPAAVMGMALIRGNPVPVLALAAVLEHGEEVCARFITVRAGAEPVALAVASVVGVQRVDVASLRELPPLLREADHGAVSAIGAADAELMLVLNAARLVPEGLSAALRAAGEAS